MLVYSTNPNPRNWMDPVNFLGNRADLSSPKTLSKKIQFKRQKLANHTQIVFVYPQRWLQKECS